MEFIDAFAGIGGIRIGLERAAKELGIQTCCVKTIEWDKECQKTYKDNFESSDILGDITKVDKNTLPSHDVLLAGFPCQVFSRNGRFYNFYKGSEKRDPKFIDEDDRHNLVAHLLEILRSKRPQAFLFENVKALTTILDREGNLFFDTLKDLIKAAGYDVHAEVLDAAEFGLPQQRNRVYIVGFRKDVELRGEFTFPKPIPLNRCVKDILEEKVDDKYFLKVLWKNRKCGKSTHRESALPDTTRLEALQAAYNGKANNASGIPVNWEDAKKISSPVDKILPVAIIYGDTPSKLPRQTDKLYSAWGISPTIATFSTPPFDTPQGWRILTPRECARLQGFDQSYVFPKSDSIAYRQIGNGVAVNVVQAVMKQLFLALV